MMKQTIRNLLLLTAMIIAGAGQVWANQPDPDPTYGILGYSSENAATDGGVLLFYNNEDCVIDNNGNHKLSENEAVLQSWLNDYRTVYIKATPDAIHTLGEDASFITVEKTQAANNINAPRRTPEVGDYCEVTAVAGKTGVYQFTMPNDESINVKVTVTFPSKPTASVNYIKADGTQGTQTAYILDGTETKLGLADKEETWYVCNTSLTYTNGLATKCDVHLILADGKKMTISADHKVESETVPGFAIEGLNKLTIYAQSEGDNAGILDYSNCSYGIYLNNRLTINGGNINGTILSSTDNIEINGGNICIESQIDNPSIWCHYNITINGGTVVAANDGNSAIESNGDVVIKGGKVTADATGNFGYGIRGKSIVLGWTNADDFIYASSYKLNEPDNAPRRTAVPGDEYTIFTADGQRFVAYTPATETVPEAATSIISGKIDNDFLINGRVLRPIAGYLVSTTDDNLTIKDNEPKFSIDNNGNTERYYEFAASTDENPVRVTVEYTIPENEEYKMRMIVVDGAELEADHGFLMPDNDVRMYGEEKVFRKNGDYTYDGEDWKNRIVLICDDPSASLLSASARRTKAPETIIPVTLDEDYEITGISKETSDNVYEAVEEAINAGTYKFTVAGLGYFFGTADVELPINRKSIDMQNVSISVKKDADGNNLVYTGSALEPVITVKYDANYGGETPDMKTIDPSEYVATVKKNTGTDNEPNYVEVAAADFIHSGSYTMFITNLANGGNYDFANDGVHENFEVEKAYMTGVKYMDWDNEKKELVEKTSDEYTPYWVLEGNETSLDADHYIASGISDLTNMSALTLTTADVWLVLADDANMIIGSDNNPVNSKGISSDYALIIYGQEKGTGRLMINSKDICIDLSNSYNGKFKLYGGHLELNNAYDNVNANALNCYSTEIYGGLLWCYSNGTAIKVAGVGGNGYYNSVYVYGGNVNIFSDRIGIDCFNCTVDDGYVKINVANTGNAINCDAINCDNDFTINNGLVFATVLEGYVGNGIHAGGKVSINGGQVTAEGQGDGKRGIICYDGTNLQDIILDWNNASNFVYANSYQGNVKIKSGKYFVEKGGTTVFGSNDEGGYVFANDNEIKGKTLVPTKNITAPKADGAATPSAYVPVANNDGNWSISGSEVKKVLVPYGLNADCSVATREVEVSGSATLPEATPLILETKANAVAIDCTGPTSNVNSGLQKILDNLPATYLGAAEAAAAGNALAVTPALFFGGDGQQTVAEQVAKTAKALLGATIPENPTLNDLLALAKDFLYFKTETKVNGTATDLVLRAAAVDLTSPATNGALIMAVDKMSLINLMHNKEVQEGAPRLGGIYLDLGDDLTGIIEHELLNSYEYSKDGWYTVDGRKLDKQPTAKGLYIRNGRKVVIK